LIYPRGRGPPAVGPQRKVCLSVRLRVQAQRAPLSCSKMSVIGRLPGGATLSKRLTAPVAKAGQAFYCSSVTPVWPPWNARAGILHKNEANKTAAALVVAFLVVCIFWPF
jgi:hypothetical protein